MPTPALRTAFQRVHVASLALCAIMLPWSTAFLSMSEMLLAANWIAGGLVLGEGRMRWRAGFATAPALIFLSFLALHLVGLLWTEDLGWGFDLCRILAPVLVFGAVLAGSDRLQAREFRTILLLGAWSAIASGLFGLFFSGAREGDYRSISMFVSHIRLALMLSFSVAVLLWAWPRSNWQRAAHVAGCIAATYLIARLGSLQGFIILGLLVLLFIWRRSGRSGPVWRIITRAGVIALLLLPIGLARLAWSAISAPVAAGSIDPAERTAGGEAYQHDTLSTQTENGTHVWTYVAWGEFYRTWGRRSQRPLEGNDALGHPLYSTAARYLSSKGLRKDSLGVMALSDAELRAIEQGASSAVRGAQGPLRARVEEVLFELEQYRSTGRADGHSVAMRMEFLRAGWAIARDHWLLGVGTGDTQRAFDAHYEESGSLLAPEWRLRAHNQYLTLWISFGALGLVLALFTWWWPAKHLKAWSDPLFQCWAVAFGVSCLTDDTIETQAGATFFALYYALFVFAAPRAVVSAPKPPAPWRP